MAKRKFPKPPFAKAARLRADRKWAEAYEIAKQAIKDATENGWGHYVLGLICRDMGRYAEAENEFRSAILILPRDLELYLILGSTLIRRNHWNDVRVVLVQTEELFPLRPELLTFRRYVEQKMRPPMDFGMLSIKKLLKKFNPALPHGELPFVPVVL